MEKRSSWLTAVWAAVITIVVILIASMLWLTLQAF
jgi:hypothetical protein